MCDIENMKVFKTRENNFKTFEIKNSKYISKLVNIKIHYKIFYFESFYENCIITSFEKVKKKYPGLSKYNKKEFHISFLSSDNILKSVVVDSNDIDVFIEMI